MASITEQGLLHDRVGGSREQRDPGDGHATYRSGIAALPQWRFLPRPCWASRHQRHLVGSCRGDERADFRRAPQGVRPPRSRHHPADFDYCVAPAARSRGRLRHRPRVEAQDQVTLAVRRNHALQLRRCVHQSRGCHRSVQHCRVLRVPAPTDAIAVRLRGQRSRHQRAHTRRVGRDIVRFASEPALCRSRGRRSHRCR